MRNFTENFVKMNTGPWKHDTTAPSDHHVVCCMFYFCSCAEYFDPKCYEAGIQISTVWKRPSSILPVI